MIITKYKEKKKKKNLAYTVWLRLWLCCGSNDCSFKTRSLISSFVIFLDLLLDMTEAWYICFFLNSLITKARVEVEHGGRGSLKREWEMGLGQKLICWKMTFAKTLVVLIWKSWPILSHITAQIIFQKRKKKHYCTHEPTIKWDSS